MARTTKANRDTTARNGRDEHEPGSTEIQVALFQ
jgi:hypothetical protein